jgi:hypothetical protein
MRTARSARSTSARSCSLADRAASEARTWSRSLAAAGWSPLESPSNAAVCRALANRAFGGWVWAKSSRWAGRSAACCRRGRSPGTGGRRRRCPLAARSGGARGLGACRARLAGGCGRRHTAPHQPRATVDPGSQIDRDYLELLSSARGWRRCGWATAGPDRCETGYRASLRGRRDPLGEPAGEVDAHDRAAVVAGGEATQLLQTAAGDDVLVAAGQQAELGGLDVGGSSLSAAARISGLIRTSSRSPDPSVPMVTVMASSW